MLVESATSSGMWGFAAERAAQNGMKNNETGVNKNPRVLEEMLHYFLEMSFHLMEFIQKVPVNNKFLKKQRKKEGSKVYCKTIWSG